jgi:hypothetical protein
MVPDLPFVPPRDVLETDEKKIEVLEKFNYNWKDWAYRDVIQPKERYSEEQKQYFATLPSERKQIVDRSHAARSWYWQPSVKFLINISLNTRIIPQLITSSIKACLISFSMPFTCSA